jgi:ribosomal protein RSM22 (predicted rRNA methylase)
VCDLETSKRCGSGPSWAVVARKKIFASLAETILMLSATLNVVSLYKMSSENYLLTKYRAKDMLALRVETTSLLP